MRSLFSALGAAATMLLAACAAVPAGALADSPGNGAGGTTPAPGASTSGAGTTQMPSAQLAGGS